MAKKQFKTESKKLLDMMVNSIYTHKEIFLRELISNASDAIDKQYFRSLTDAAITTKREDYAIRITADKEQRTLTIQDNGCGMSREELETNLGTIAKSGSFDFKNGPQSGEDQENRGDIDIIGQFGVGFYSAFMVADHITVESRAYGAQEANCWESSGADGYTINPCDKAETGTVITLHLKEDTEDEHYTEYLEEYRLRELVKKYSDYIRYPIRMLTHTQKKKEGTEDQYETVSEDQTLNSMVPLWKKSPSEVTQEAYDNFYSEKFYDWEAPLATIRQKSEGTSEFTSLLFIPAHAPFNYYSRDYEKGLQLYSSGVLIMDKCKDLLPDYFSFIRGLVDSADLSLNISREMLQHDRQLKIIARAVEKKIASELGKMLRSDREKYEKFFSAFGTQLKWGVYSDYGTHKETLQDLLLFRSSEGKMVTLKEYVDRMAESQKKIYYASGDTVEKIALLPQVESVLAHGYEVLYLTEDVDEFALQVMRNYSEKEFSNVCTDSLDLATDEEKTKLQAENEAAKELFAAMKSAIGDSVHTIRFTNTLKTHAACLSSEGAISANMEKVLSEMPGNQEMGLKAELVLEINIDHPLCAKLRTLYEENREALATYSKILYAQARLVSGLGVENPAEVSALVCDLMAQA